MVMPEFPGGDGLPIAVLCRGLNNGRADFT